MRRLPLNPSWGVGSGDEEEGWGRGFYDMEQTMKSIFFYVDFRHFSSSHSAANVRYF